MYSLIGYKYFTMADNTNPNAPNKALPLAPISNNVADLVRQDFDPEALLRYSITFPLSNGPSSFSSLIHQLPGFVNDVVSVSMYVELHSLEVTIDSFTSGVNIACAVSHDAEATPDSDNILLQKSHCSHRTTDFTSGTVNHTLPLFSGMTRQLKPTPINGFYPNFLYYSNAAGEGSLTLHINYKRRGPVIGRFVMPNPNTPSPPIPQPQPTDPIAARPTTDEWTYSGYRNEQEVVEQAKLNIDALNDDDISRDWQSNRYQYFTFQDRRRSGTNWQIGVYYNGQGLLFRPGKVPNGFARLPGSKLWFFPYQPI